MFAEQCSAHKISRTKCSNNYVHYSISATVTFDTKLISLISLIFSVSVQMHVAVRDDKQVYTVVHYIVIKVFRVLAKNFP